MASLLARALVLQATACVRAGLLLGVVSSVVSAQVQLLEWTLIQHGSGSSTLSTTGFGITADDQAGSVIAYTTQIPVAMRLSCDMTFTTYDGASGTSAPLMIVGQTVSQITTSSQLKPLVIDLPAGVTFGLGLQQIVQNWPGQVSFTAFTLTPIPVTMGGPAAGDGLGASLAALGDVDGDGVIDLAAGRPQHANGRGGVVLLSGASGAILWEIDGDTAGDHLGASVGVAGDVSGDGTPDVIAGAPSHSANTGLALVVSGSDGGRLFTFLGNAAGDELGSAVAGAGDVNGDGVPDVMVGSPHADLGGADSGAARVFSGSDGSVLHLFVGGQAGVRAGTAVGSLGDANADGLADVVVGAPMDAGGFGAVRVHSGVDGAVLQLFVGAAPVPGLLFGNNVAALGDLDGDGTRELAVGEPLWNHGKVHVYSGARGSTLFVLDPDSFTWEMGASIADAGDVNGDGFDDVVAGAPELSLPSFHKMGRAFVFSGRDGSLLWKLSGGTNHDAYGSAVAGIGDRDGDGLAEIAIGVPKLDAAGTDSGGVELRAFFVNWFDLGQGLAGSNGTPKLSGLGLLFPGAPVTLKLTGAKPFAPAALIVGLSQLSAPFKGGVLVPFPDLFVAGLPIPANGTLTLKSTWPSGVPGNLKLYFQEWIADPGAMAGMSASNALSALTP